MTSGSDKGEGPMTLSVPSTAASHCRRELQHQKRFWKFHEAGTARSERAGSLKNKALVYKNKVTSSLPLNDFLLK